MKINRINFKEINSTNLYLMQNGEKYPEGTLVVADRQNNGKGRTGKTFLSDLGGVYFSLLLKPENNEQPTLITVAAAVAAAKAAEKLCRKRIKIKWVNDLYLDGKKICGILTEGAFSSDGHLNFAVLGVGLNLKEPNGGFPDQIKDIASSLFKDCDFEKNREKFLKFFLKYFLRYYKNLYKKKYLKEYRKRDFLLGKEVRFLKGNKEIAGKAVGIDPSGGLVVDTKDGIVTLFEGEVSRAK